MIEIEFNIKASSLEGSVFQDIATLCLKEN